MSSFFEDLKKNEERLQEIASSVVKYAKEKFPNAKWNKLIITFDGDEVVLGYDFINEPFQRLRRITGYLTGDVHSWNDAKLAELEDRVTHDLSSKMEILE